MDKGELRKYSLIIGFLLLTYLSYRVVKPFFGALVGAITLAYIFYPIYKALEEKTKRKEVASLLTCALIVILIIVPLVVVANLLIQESVSLYKSDFLKDLEVYTGRYTSEEFPYSGIISQVVFKAIEYVQNASTQVFTTIPQGILGFIIAIYTLYYLFMKGEELLEHVKEIIPIKEKNKLINNIAKTTYSIVYGLFAVVIIEVILTAVGFAVLGVTSPVLWGLIIGFLALIPFVGPAVVWAPLALYEFFTGSVYIAIGIAIVGIIISIVDTFLRPLIIGEKSKLSPVIVLLGILGGLEIFGFVGIIVGPLVLSTLIETVKLYHAEYFD